MFPSDVELTVIHFMLGNTFQIPAVLYIVLK